MKEKPTFLHPLVIIGFFVGVTLAKRAGCSKKSRKALLLMLLLLILLLPLQVVPRWSQGGPKVVPRWYILKVEHAVNLGLCLMCIL